MTQTRWLAVLGSEVVGACVADDVAEARVKLREVIAKHPGAFVQSAISHALGYGPKVEGVERKPASAARKAAVARANRALRARKRKARDMGLQSGASRQSSAQSHIWRGIVNRQAKRTQTET